MEIHAEYFLKCSEAAKWLNTPQPVSGIPKEFLDGAHAISNRISPAQQAHISNPTSFLPTPPSQTQPSTTFRTAIDKNRRPTPQTTSKASRTPLHPPILDKPARLTALPEYSPDRDVHALFVSFPDLSELAQGSPITKALLYVPVQLHEHFVFGVAIGCPVPPPAGVSSAEWAPLVNRFVLDAGRKCCLMFSYFAEGSIVVSVDCFDEVGDHFSEVTFFEPTPVVGVFPRGIRGRMQIFEKRDCPTCTLAAQSCVCPVQERIEAIVKTRQSRVVAPEQGPAHAGASYKDDQVTIQTYPYWAQMLDEYKWSRVGSYCVQIRYTPVSSSTTARPRPPTSPSSSGGAVAASREPTSLAFRSSFTAEPRIVVEKMLRVSLFDKGVSALKPPATDVRWESSSTVAVDANDAIRVETDPVQAVCVTDWHKLPGFQEDYLLVAPSNIVTGAHARAELARAEAERLAAQARSGVPVLPSWASGRAGVFEHILNESGPELDMIRGAVEDDRSDPPSQDFHAQMLRQIPQASAGTVMRPRGSLDSAGKRVGYGEDRRRFSRDDNVRRASLESGLVSRGGSGRRSGFDGRGRIVEEVRRSGVDGRVVEMGARRTGIERIRRAESSGSPRSSYEGRTAVNVQASVDSNRRSGAELNRKRRTTQNIPSPISIVPL